VKKQYPKISIITPSINQGKYIEETIVSVLSQDYPFLEYIIADGGSTDGTLAILEKYAGKVKWFSKKDRGQAEAINRGIEMATGEIISYLNSDDILFSKALLKIADAFIAHPESKWITGYCRVIDKNSQETRPLITFYKKALLNMNCFHLMLITDFISQPATFWRRELINEIGLFDEGLHYAMDYDYFLRIWQRYRPYLIRETLAGFRIHQNSKSTTLKNYEAYVREEKMIIKRYSKSRFWSFMHDAHRLLMTTIYSKIN
jgi:glycosyltransferase involved in cell wall biosynthesis